jgi:signal transduction histidine kinase
MLKINENNKTDIEDSTTKAYKKEGKGPVAFYSANPMLVDSFVSMFEYLIEERELIQSLVQTKTRLIKSDGELELQRLQNDFINIAAHELKTPVQPILALTVIWQTELINSESGQEESKKGSITISSNEIDILRRNALKLERLASEILTVTKIENKTLKLRLDRFDISKLISITISDIISHSKNDRSIKVLFDNNNNNSSSSIDSNYISSSISNNNDNKEGEIVVEADKVRIVEVIDNLLRNALRHAKSEIIVSLTKVENNSNVAVSITDDGEGIPAEMLPKLFTKFGSRSSTGTGLGLFISKNIIEAHGGRITGWNNPDRNGATFIFTLPIAKTE